MTTFRQRIWIFISSSGAKTRALRPDVPRWQLFPPRSSKPSLTSRLLGSFRVSRSKKRRMVKGYGMAELPPPSLLLGRCEGGKHCAGEQGAPPGPSHDQRPNPSAGGYSRREAVQPEGTESGADGRGSRRVPLPR